MDGQSNRSYDCIVATFGIVVGAFGILMGLIGLTIAALTRLNRRS
jgi:hypothetical protein